MAEADRGGRLEGRRHVISSYSGPSLGLWLRRRWRIVVGTHVVDVVQEIASARGLRV